MPEALTLRPFFWRATRLFPDTEVVSRTREGTQRYAYADFGDRVRRLAGALRELGVEPGDRVGTLAWNTHRHFEAYYAVPLSGAQLHTVNLLLQDDHVEYIVNDAADDVLLADRDAVETLDRLWDRIEGVREVVVMGESVPETESDLPLSASEELIADADPMQSWPAARRDGPGRDVLHVGDHGKTEGRRVHPQDDIRPRDDGDDALGARHRRVRRGDARRTDVSRELVGVPLRRDDGGRKAGVSGTVAGPGGSRRADRDGGT